MDDIQSWWEVPSIAHFCSLFRVAFNLLDFDIEELEEALLTDGTELNGSSLLQDLIVRLLCGCLGHNGISTFNYQMFLRRLFRTKCKEQGRDNPFNTDIDFQFLPLRTKVEILHALCDFRLDADDVIDVLKNLDSDSLRVHPLGHDETKAAYWYFYGTRLYKEEYPKKRKRKKDHDKYKSKKKRNRNETSSEEETDELGTTGTWKVMCFTEEDWRNLADSLEGSMSKEERALHAVLSEDFLPEIPRLFEEKERLQKKRLLENQPRRQSQRIEKLKSMKNEIAEQQHQQQQQQHNSTKAKEDERYLEREKVNREKIERRERRAARALRRSRSISSNSSIDCGDITGPLPAGRQTNNSLASATGEIIIKPTRQKFRNSQLFRRTREDLMTGMYKILDRVKAHDDAWPFLDPVDEAYAPKYYAVIAKPMDLQTMEDKLDNGEYGSLQQFRADFQLIVDNCRQYNGSGNEYTEMVRRLQELFEASAERYLEIEPSSEEEQPLEENQSDDTLGSSLTPLNGPRSHSFSSISNTSCSDREDLSNYENSFTNSSRCNAKEHKSRFRKRQKRKSRSVKDDFSSADDSRESLQSRNSSDLHHNMKRATSLTDSSNDRSKNIIKKSGKKEKQRVNRDDFSDERGVLKEHLIKANNRDLSRERNKIKDLPLTNDTYSERNRTRVINYKEEETSESEILSDSTDSSNYNSKFNKQKTPPKKPVKRAGVIKNSEALAALELATEQTLKDINRWLDDTPKFSEFSSNSNSPLHVPYTEEMASIEGEYRRRLQMDRPQRPRDRLANDLHRRRMFKEQLGLKRRKEVQRTIDRLQPGKSKGNLLSKENQDNSGIETKFPTSDNDDNTPKISLGKVLASDVLGFGIVGDSSSCKKDSEDDCTEDKLIIEEDHDSKEDKAIKEEDESVVDKDSVLVVKEEKPVVEVVEPKKEKPTPNLSAWFKAFGAPKAQVTVKKKTDQEELRLMESAKSVREEEVNVEEEKKITCVIDSPARRQRKASTGSSVSERSSFSQEPNDGNSPRPSIDEPYLSPQQEPKPYHHSPINGTIKVGFYQDTCFPRGSSEKSSSPRDLPSCSPRDLPSVSPRTPYCSPRTPYCSPRNAPISPRDYPNASPRTPYCSPRNRPISPRDYPNSSPHELPNSSPSHHFSNASPQELVANLMRRDYLNESVKEMPISPPLKENLPNRSDYQQPFSPLPHGSNTPIYGGLSPYPTHLSYIDNSKSISEHYRNVDKTPLPVYPVKKRAYSDLENVPQTAKPSPEQLSCYKGASFTPTRGAMEQERTFTPTPGRMPGPSQPLRVTDQAIPLGLTHPLQHHLIDPYGDERHLSSPYYATSEGVYNKGQTVPPTTHPIFSQPSVLTSTIPHNFERHQGDNSQSRMLPTYDTRNAAPGYPPATSQPESQYKPKPPILNYTNRNSPSRMSTSPNSSLPINYSNVSNEHLNKESTLSVKVSESQRLEDMPTTSTTYGKVDTGELDQHGAKLNAAYTNSSRLSEMMPPKVNTSYNRPIPEISPGSINYPSSQDLGKISVPLSYSNQSDILAGKMNYNHPMAELMQTSAARYNYQMSELIQGKSAVYNHPMQDFIQGKSYSNMMQPNLAATYNRPISEIMQRKVNDIQSSEMVYPPPRSSLPVNKTEPAPKPKKGRKKKGTTIAATTTPNETTTTPSGFQQYIAPATTEPLSLKTSGVPGSAFNFGPPPPQLKESYSYLDEIRSPYYVSRNETSPTKGGTAPHTAPSYFLGHASSREPPTYPPHALYNPYLQCAASRHSEELLRPMVLHQGLLPPAGYPPGYLGMHHNAINRPSWL